MTSTEIGSQVGWRSISNKHVDGKTWDSDANETKIAFFLGNTMDKAVPQSVTGDLTKHFTNNYPIIIHYYPMIIH